MKRKLPRLARLVLWPVLLAVPLWLAAQKWQSRAEYALPRYPSSPAFDYAVQHHLNYARYEYGGLRPLQTTFRATWFQGGQPSVQRFTSVDAGENDNVYSGRSEFGTRGFLFALLKSTGRSWELSNAQFLKVRDLLEHMPLSSPRIPQGRLLIVTFEGGGTYQTRLYDRAHLPPTVREIYRITGAPIEELTE